MASDDTETSPGHTVRANGVEIFYKAYGQGRPLLLIHGGTLNGDSWQPYVAAFAERFRVIVPDTPGHGESGTPADTLTYPGLADDMAAFIGALDLREPLIAGYSDGGQIGLEIGMRHPALPRALIVGGAFFRFNPSMRAWLTDVFGEEPADIDTDRFLSNHPEWAEWFEQIYGPDAWPSILARVRPMWTTPLDYGPNDFARIVVPTMVLVGDRDAIVPLEEAVEMYRRLPAAELAVIADADHGSILSAKVNTFQPVMLDFLLRHSAQA